MKLCRCVRSNPTVCLMERYHASKSFSECMGGCDCPCHFRNGGILIAREDWMGNRYMVACAKQMMEEERHTDPRIEAVMPEKARER
jgi:hypothetical protein